MWLSDHGYDWRERRLDYVVEFPLDDEEERGPKGHTLQVSKEWLSSSLNIGLSLKRK